MLIKSIPAKDDSKYAGLIHAEPSEYFEEDILMAANGSIALQSFGNLMGKTELELNVKVNRFLDKFTAPLPDEVLRVELTPSNSVTPRSPIVLFTTWRQLYDSEYSKFRFMECMLGGLLLLLQEYQSNKYEPDNYVFENPVGHDEIWRMK